MVQYYDSSIMEQLALQLRQIIMSWPHVTSGEINGCPAYYANDQLFCLLVTHGVVLVNISDDLRSNLDDSLNWTYFDGINYLREMDNPSILISLEKYRFTEVLPSIELVYHIIMNRD